MLATIKILTLVEGWYDAAEFTGEMGVESSMFPELSLMVEQILRGEI